MVNRKSYHEKGKLKEVKTYIAICYHFNCTNFYEAKSYTKKGFASLIRGNGWKKTEDNWYCPIHKNYASVNKI